MKSPSSVADVPVTLVIRYTHWCSGVTIWLEGRPASHTVIPIMVVNQRLTAAATGLWLVMSTGHLDDSIRDACQC